MADTHKAKPFYNEQKISSRYKLREYPDMKMIDAPAGIRVVERVSKEKVYGPQFESGDKFVGAGKVWNKTRPLCTGAKRRSK